MISKENIKKNMIKNIFSSIKDTINEVTAESKNFRKSEKQSTAIPVQPQIASSNATPSDSAMLLYNQQLAYSELTQLLVKALKGLPDFFNIKPIDCSVSMPIWKTNEYYAIRLYKGDSAKELTYATFCTVILPEFQRRIDSVNFSAYKDITDAYTRYCQDSCLLYDRCVNGYYGTDSSTIYQSEQVRLDRDYQLVLAHNMPLLYKIHFCSFRDYGFYIDFYFTVSQSQ